MSTPKKQSQTKLTSKKTLTKKDIAEHVGPRSFQRGLEYFESGAVFDCRRQGDWLKARCRGRSAADYRIRLQLKKGTILNGECDCPVGSDGNCKHVAAMLLTWLQMPDEFQEIELLEKQLANCSKDQLIELIQEMIDREPDLESWLELALPTEVRGEGGTAMTSEPYSRQTVAAFSSAEYGWEADQELTATLKSLQKIGDRFRAGQNPEAAATVYRGILEGFVDEYDADSQCTRRSPIKLSSVC